MTPQERARDLCEKFEGILGRSIPTGDDPFFPESKECAKMCVQEIIDQLQQLHKPEYVVFSVTEDNYENGYDKLEHWEQTLKAIDNI